MAKYKITFEYFNAHSNEWVKCTFTGNGDGLTKKQVSDLKSQLENDVDKRNIEIEVF